MGSTADHQHDFEEIRVPPAQWEKGPDAIKPDYYKVTIKGVEMDIIDIADAYQLPPCLFNAFKYIARAGKKPGEPKEKDLNKAIESVQRELGKSI